ncbi:hypothetical protein PR048_020043 [Dryococelus australis]|uniref:DNA helicase Pif1-like 2B domain-containing protein n=1 Tax=Dryococelus australis TaxID=614101 RepID=A0ABQ9H562_9NEOP|nr:hypothetical protein PR048_020043 [Dryococelus australis]
MLKPVCPKQSRNGKQDWKSFNANYDPTEFLNSLDLPGMPPHMLTLKVDVPIILLRNINPSRLCNTTRLSVKKMMNKIIKVKI